MEKNWNCLAHIVSPIASVRYFFPDSYIVGCVAPSRRNVAINHCKGDAVGHIQRNCTGKRWQHIRCTKKQINGGRSNKRSKYIISSGASSHDRSIGNGAHSTAVYSLMYYSLCLTWSPIIVLSLLHMINLVWNASPVTTPATNWAEAKLSCGWTHSRCGSNGRQWKTWNVK